MACVIIYIFFPICVFHIHRFFLLVTNQTFAHIETIFRVSFHSIDAVFFGHFEWKKAHIHSHRNADDEGKKIETCFAENDSRNTVEYCIQMNSLVFNESSTLVYLLSAC